MRHKRTGDTLTFILEGELDHSLADEIRGELDALLTDRSIKRLILDLEKLSFMDSSGIGVVLGRYNLLAKRKGTVAVRNPSNRVDRIFRMSGIYQIIEKMQ